MEGKSAVDHRENKPGSLHNGFCSLHARQLLFARGENRTWDTCLLCSMSQEAYLVTVCPRQIRHGPLLLGCVSLDPSTSAIVPVRAVQCSLP